MTDKARIRIAAAVTALFVAGISAAGLVAHGHQPQPASPAATAAIAPSTNATTAARGDDGSGTQGDDEHERDE